MNFNTYFKMQEKTIRFLIKKYYYFHSNFQTLFNISPSYNYFKLSIYYIKFKKKIDASHNNMEVNIEVNYSRVKDVTRTSMYYRLFCEKLYVIM